MGISCVLSLYSHGSTTGIVIDCGYSSTTTIPIENGYPLPGGIKKLDIGGRDISNYLLKLLQEKGYNYDDSHINLINDIKEKTGFVALDYEREIEKGNLNELTYGLPDGNVIKLGTERFKCAEALFQPNLIGLEAPNVMENLETSVFCDENVEGSYVFGVNQLITGGGSFFPGLTARIKKELNNYRTKYRLERITIASSNKKYSAWIGGSILGSLSGFEQMSMSNEEYDEFGPSYIHKKFC